MLGTEFRLHKSLEARPFLGMKVTLMALGNVYLTAKFVTNVELGQQK